MTFRRQRTVATVARSGLLLAAALTLTACQQAEPDVGGEEAPAPGTASSSPASGATDPQQSGASPERSGSGESGRSEDGSSAAGPAATAAPDDALMARLEAVVSEHWGEAPETAESRSVEDNEAEAAEAVDVLQDESGGIDGDECRAALREPYERRPDLPFSSALFVAPAEDGLPASTTIVERYADAEAAAQGAAAGVAPFTDDACAGEDGVPLAGGESRTEEWQDGTLTVTTGGPLEGSARMVAATYQVGAHVYRVDGTATAEDGGAPDTDALLDQHKDLIIALQEAAESP